MQQQRRTPKENVTDVDPNVATLIKELSKGMQPALVFLTPEVGRSLQQSHLKLCLTLAISHSRHTRTERGLIGASSLMVSSLPSCATLMTSLNF